MMKKNKLLFTTFAMLSSVALLAACGGDDGAGAPAPTVEYTLTVTQDTLELNLFETEEVTAIAMQDGEIIENAEIEWSSSATNVVTVVDGIVEPVSYGISVITATWQGKTATCNVTVADNGMIPALNVDEADTGLQLFATSEPCKVQASVFYRDLTYDTSSALFTYTIAESEQTVATVNAQGYVTPVGVGTATLTVSAEWKGYSGSGMQKNVEITVVNDIQTKINGGAEELHLFNGTIGTQSYSNTATFTADVQYNGETVDAGVTWHSTAPTVASVDGGVVTALTVGETQIYYTHNDGSDVYESPKMTVKVSPVEVALTETLGEIVLIKNADAVTTDYVLNVNGLAEQASTVSKAVTATGEELRASYDKTNKQLIIYNNQVDGTADEYLQGVIGVKDGGEQSLTIYTEENVCYTAKVTVVSREITTADGLNAFFASYETDTQNGSANATYGQYVTLGSNITDYEYYLGVANYAKNCVLEATFDGRGYAIQIKSGETAFDGSFFGYKLGTAGVIKNTAFLGLSKTGAKATGVLIRGNAGVIDNCYVECSVSLGSTHLGGITYANAGTISNTIVNMTVTEGEPASGKVIGTIVGQNNTGAVMTNCFSISSDATKVQYADGKKKTTDGLAFDANGLKEAIETASNAANTLPESYNSYWNLTENGLSFGNTEVLTFTAQG